MSAPSAHPNRHTRHLSPSLPTRLKTPSHSVFSNASNTVLFGIYQSCSAVVNWVLRSSSGRGTHFATIERKKKASMFYFLLFYIFLKSLSLCFADADFAAGISALWPCMDIWPKPPLTYCMRIQGTVEHLFYIWCSIDYHCWVRPRTCRSRKNDSDSWVRTSCLFLAPIEYACHLAFFSLSNLFMHSSYILDVISNKQREAIYGHRWKKIK